MRSLLLLSIFLLLFWSAQAQIEDDYVDTTVLSHVLDRLTNKTIYDKRLRPRYGDKPVDVGITIHVSSISAVSEVDMDFTLDFYMRQTWQDPRLAFGELRLGGSDKPIKSLTVGVDYLEKLWKPDTFFPNEKKSFFHVATTHNSFLRIDADGTVYTSQRLTVTAVCHMKLQLFPMDSQRCKLEIESYGYSTADIIYLFGEKDSISRSEFELPQFVLVDVKITNKTEKLSSGEYSRLVCYFFFKRNIGFYVIQIYLPSMLIVIISWVSFWLSRDATPARVALGVTTVLTMTTLMTTTNSAMPKVSYVKSIDIFLGVCFMMVFCSLLEYAAVGYLNKRVKLMAAQRKESRAPLLGSPDAPAVRATSVPAAFYNQGYRPFYSSTDRSNGYTTADIDYFWGNRRGDKRHKAVVFDDFSLPQFQQTGYNVNVTMASTSSGNYVRLHFEVLLIRNLGFYLMNIVIPSVLIVTISWVSFWLNREASPARVGLGVTTVLTMTTLITTTNNSMPKVSYVKGLDVFLNFCFVMVFASLVEYAVVSYLNKRIALRREKRRKQAEAQQRTEVPMFNNASPKQPNNNSFEMAYLSQNSTPAKSLNNADMYYGANNSSMHQLMEIPVDCDCRTIPLIQHPRLVPDAPHTLWPAPFGRPKKASKSCRLTPAIIDKYSRSFFPMVFIGFNVLYWTIMTVLSSISANVGTEDWSKIQSDH